MVTTRLNGTFNGTLHHKGESPEYYVEQSARRPRRQRRLALFLVAVVAPLLVAYTVVDLPRPNTVATVVGTGVPPISQQPGDAGRTPVPGTAPVAQTLADVAGLRITYVLDGTETTVDIAVTDTDYDSALLVHPIGSTMKVHAYPADQLSGTPARATMPKDQTAAGGALLALALVGAGLLWLAARRNEARGPLSMPVLLDPR
jgi:hypothetical protein